MNISLSIIVPVYRVEPWVEDCMRSIAAQTRQDFELILVDDCGGDKSVEKALGALNESHAKFPVFVLQHEHNRGLSAARNTGIAKAQGKWLLFIDSDDELIPNAVEWLLGKAEETGAEMVVGGIEMGGTSNNPDGRGFLPRQIEELKTKEDVLQEVFRKGWYNMAWNKLLRRDFVVSHKLYFEEGLIHEDGPWSFKVNCHLSHVVIEHRPTYIYKIRENSIQTDKNLRRHFDAFVRVHQLWQENAKECGIAERKDFLHWMEKSKAFVYHTYVKPMKSSEGNKRFYRMVRTIAPNPRLTISHFHYYVYPYCLGFWLYKKTVGHLWAY